MPSIMLLASLLLATATVVRADDFDRLEGPLMKNLTSGPAAKPIERLTLEEMGQLPSPIRGSSGAVLVVRTDQDNLARVEVDFAFRKNPGVANAEARPVAILQRFATFESSRQANRLARGQDILLFDGFQFDLDSGHVVPEGQGGDLRFQTGASPALVNVDSASMWAVVARPEFPEGPAGQPSSSRTILPTDYAGRFRLFADGSRSGTLDLMVQDRRVSGQFRSDQTGTRYPVIGEITTDPMPRIRFAIEFPMTRDEYEGALFSQGKGAMAGTVQQLERSHAFFAIREGGRIAPEGADDLDLIEGSHP